MSKQTRSLVSICVPTYNSACFVRETLDSLLTQTYPHMEIIVSDNASVDGTQEILREYAEQYEIKLLLNGQNLGAGGNFNRLVAAAQGEFIAIYHADDVYLPTIVEESVAVLAANPGVGLVGTMARTIDEAGNPLYVYALPEGLTGMGIIYEFDEAMLGVLRTASRSIFFITPSIMVRAQAYKLLGNFDQATYRSSVDYEMWLRIASRYPVAVLDRELMQYRLHAGQGSELEVRKNADLPDILSVIEAYDSMIQADSVKRECAAVIDRIHVKTALKQNYQRSYSKSSTTLRPVKGWKYSLAANGIRVANYFGLNLRIWP